MIYKEDQELNNMSSGHFCYVCGENRHNEKFSGKGRKKHLCKECIKEGLDKIDFSAPAEKYSEHHYSRKVKNPLVLLHDAGMFLLFEYGKRKYILAPEPDFNIYQFLPDVAVFIIAEEFKDSSNIWNACASKMEGSIHVEPWEFFEAFEVKDEFIPPLPDRKKKFIDVVSALENIQRRSVDDASD